MTKIGWQFPKTNWGSEGGKNDPGLETFRGNPYPSLAREPIQNSIDAHDKSDNPVRVEFSVFKIAKEEFPDRDEYKNILNRCIQEAKDGSETQQEMQKALNIIEQDEIYFMKVSDYNTVGLSGSDELRNTNWHRLIKVVGESEKEETSGGAFGIGKHASFVCSDLKVVFYSTLDTEEKKAFQGVAKLISFEDEDGEPRQATGFYGETEKNQPIKDMSKINTQFVRQEVGTDLFIAGFDFRESWAEEISEAVITSFFIAIHEGSLEVVVDGKSINSTNLSKYIQELQEKGSKSNVIKYYEVLTSDNSSFFEEEDFHGLGKVQLYVANKNTYNKKTAMIRKTGMVIKEKQNYQIPTKYAAVLLIKGDAFNKELKRIENPTHTDWEFSRKKDIKVIKDTLKELNKWMNKSIKSISPYEEVESFDVDELSEFLPDDLDETEIEIDPSTNEGERGTPLESKLKQAKKTTKKKKKSNISDWEDPVGDETMVKAGNENPMDSPPKPEPEPEPEPEPNPNPNPEPEPTPLTEKEVRAKISNYRLYCTNPNDGKYKIKLESKNDGVLTIEMEILGEDSDTPANILHAHMNGMTLPVNLANIGPFKVQKGSNFVEFDLVEKVRVAMGVSFNGQ
ncbi:hypothetical protein ACQKP0_15920 [Heyndrickxia sp. NPDC080065]|uniref:hypothetical protein n=1 Tax=Heyndrickxia sp. NPDC080065 TaxID=3390568 RepID=UPI003CFC55C2